MISIYVGCGVVVAGVVAVDVDDCPPPTFVGEIGDISVFGNGVIRGDGTLIAGTRTIEEQSSIALKLESVVPAGHQLVAYSFQSETGLQEVASRTFISDQSPQV